MRPGLGIKISFVHLSILQRCLVVSLAVHGLLVLIFSGVVVTQQIVAYVQRNPPMVPLVNVQLSREMEVRTQTRRQFTPLPNPEPVAIGAAEPMIHAPTPEPPLAVAPGIPAAQPDHMAIQLPTQAPRLTMPAASDVASLALAPIAPIIGPVVVTPLTPTPLGKFRPESGATEGLVNAQLADATASIFGGAPGPVAAPPATATSGSGDGRAGPLTGQGGAAGPFNAGALAIVPPPRPLPPPQPVASVPPIRTPNDTLVQRSFDDRQKALERYGGSAKTEAAVAHALAFLARTQESDGHWTKFNEAEKAGIGQTTAHDAGLTGLAALAFLAADYSPTAQSIYQEPTRKALAYLRGVQKPDGDLRNGGNMYDQAIGTLALAEAAAMTRDPAMRDAALHGGQFIIAAQNSDGGWRYSPRDTFSDTSVLGWQVMALHSAERIGLELPPDLATRAIGNIAGKSSGTAGMLTGYLTGIPTSAMTAEALYARLLLGMPLRDEQIIEAVGYLLQKPPESAKPNYYYWYYGSLGLLQLNKSVPDAWRAWNGHMCEALLTLQIPAGSLQGSWDTDGEWGDRGGRVYTTALAALTLEVYYRYPVAGK